MNRHALEPELVREFEDRRDDQPAQPGIPLTGDEVHEPILAGNDNAGATVSRDPRARLTV